MKSSQRITYKLVAENPKIKLRHFAHKFSLTSSCLRVACQCCAVSSGHSPVDMAYEL